MFARVMTSTLKARLARSCGESGQSLVIVILSMFVMLAMAGFAIDVANLELAHHRAQVAADAGALAAASKMEDTTATPAQVTTEGSTIAGYNDPGGTVTITQPGGSSGSQAAATVNQTLNLPFAGVFGFKQGSVTASATAQLKTEQTQVADGDISAKGCGNGSNNFCEYYTACPNNNINNCPYPPAGYITSSIGTPGNWQITSVAENPDTSFNSGYTSVDLQDCGGAVSGSCSDASASDNITNSTEVVDLNGATEGGMYETVKTVTGAKYVLSFLLTANPAGNSATYDTFTGDVQITNGNNNQYTPNCRGANNASPTCECPASHPSVIACLAFTHSNPFSNGSEVASFEEKTLSFTAASSQTTITFNSSTYGNNVQPWMYFGPEVTNVDLNYPADSLVQ